jgi:methyl-accepting chemotaxis protein
MSPEAILIITGIFSALGAGAVKLINAIVERRVRQMAESVEEDRKEREQKRNIEMEQMRQKTAQAQQQAEQAQAIGENLTNLTSAVLELVQSNNAEQHATRSALTNQAQSMGDQAESIDRVATAVNENTSVTRTANAKADAVVSAVENLQKVVLDTSKQILDLLKAPDTVQSRQMGVTEK